MDTVVTEIEERLRAYDDPIEVAVLGCAVNGIGEASHADFGIAGAKNMGVVYSKGQALRKVPQEQLVDVLFEEIDKYYAAGKQLVVDADQAAAGAALLAEIEAENAGEMTPERMAALEHEATEAQGGGDDVLRPGAPALDESQSPVAGRRFSRA
jgi:(E)-4-hydroxy-3-methylbut-2-enyl-diphosphate synthase